MVAAGAVGANDPSLKVMNARKWAVIGPEDEGRAIDALRFSLASDIVELVVLTGDEALPANPARGRGAAAAPMARALRG